MIIFGVFIIALWAAALWFAFKFGIRFACWLMGLIWTDPTYANTPKVIARMKELCVNGDMQEESARLIVAREFNLEDKVMADMLEGISMLDFKGALRGDVGASARHMLGQVFRGIGGKKW